MPRGGPRVGAGRPRKNRGTVASPVDHGVAGEPILPLDYMLAVINDQSIDAARRDRMAVAAAPYLHPKRGEGGKKEAAQAASDAASDGRFAPKGQPKLVVNNR